MKPILDVARGVNAHEGNLEALVPRGPLLGEMQDTFRALREGIGAVRTLIDELATPALLDGSDPRWNIELPELCAPKGPAVIPTTQRVLVEGSWKLEHHLADGVVGAKAIWIETEDGQTFVVSISQNIPKTKDELGIDPRVWTDLREQGLEQLLADGRVTFTAGEYNMSMGGLSAGWLRGPDKEIIFSRSVTNYSPTRVEALVGLAKIPSLAELSGDQYLLGSYVVFPGRAQDPEVLKDQISGWIVEVKNSSVQITGEIEGKRLD